MSPPEEPLRREITVTSPLRRILHLGLMILIGLSPLIIIRDLHSAYVEYKRHERDGSAEKYSASIKSVVNGQLVELGKVNPMVLVGKFSGALADSVCNYPFLCEPIKQQTRPAYIGNIEVDLPVASPPPPKLIHQLVTIPIPSWHAISATPYAAWQMAVAVKNAGGWAIAMFLSCTVIWAALLVRVARGETPIMAYFMVIFAPLCISLMVMCVQWLCETALNTLGVVGCVVVAGIMAIAHSSALALIVGFRHLYKAPLEVVEEVKVLRSIP
jgi:hypothetical protein